MLIDNQYVRRREPIEVCAKSSHLPYLLRRLTIERSNQVWATDIADIPMARGFVYITAVMDWITRRILT
jgi:putative transposase